MLPPNGLNGAGLQTSLRSPRRIMRTAASDATGRLFAWAVQRPGESI